MEQSGGMSSFRYPTILGQGVVTRWAMIKARRQMTRIAPTQNTKKMQAWIMEVMSTCLINLVHDMSISDSSEKHLPRRRFRFLHQN